MNQWDIFQKIKLKTNMMSKFLNNVIGIFIYMIIFSAMIRVGYSSEIISNLQLLCISFILAFFAGEINNIERVLRELFDKNYKK